MTREGHEIEVQFLEIKAPAAQVLDRFALDRHFAGRGHADHRRLVVAFRCRIVLTDRLDDRTGLLVGLRSEEHTSELQYLLRIPYAVLCLTIINTPETITYF